MVERVRLVHLPPVVDDQAVEQAEQILESGLRRAMLRQVEERALGRDGLPPSDATEKGHEA